MWGKTGGPRNHKICHSVKPDCQPGNMSEWHYLMDGDYINPSPSDLALGVEEPSVCIFGGDDKYCPSWHSQTTWQRKLQSRRETLSRKHQYQSLIQNSIVLNYANSFVTRWQSAHQKSFRYQRVPEISATRVAGGAKTLRFFTQKVAAWLLRTKPSSPSEAWAMAQAKPHSWRWLQLVFDSELRLQLVLFSESFAFLLHKLWVDRCWFKNWTQQKNLQVFAPFRGLQYISVFYTDLSSETLQYSTFMWGPSSLARPFNSSSQALRHQRQAATPQAILNRCSVKWNGKHYLVIEGEFDVRQNWWPGFLFAKLWMQTKLNFAGSDLKPKSICFAVVQTASARAPAGPTAKPQRLHQVDPLEGWPQQSTLLSSKLIYNQQ